MTTYARLALSFCLVLVVSACIAGQATVTPSEDIALESAAEAMATATESAPINTPTRLPTVTATATDSLSATVPPTVTQVPATETPMATNTRPETTEDPANSTTGPTPTGAAAIVATATPISATPTVVQATPLPSGETSSSISPAPVGAAAPRYYETTISIPTYGYEAAFVLTQPDDPIYPYPRLDFSQVGPPVSRSYMAIVLENGFVSLTIVPDLGGRIYRWVDKATGRHLLYENPVVKPTSWGYRGWWLAAGGIEWAFPVAEHGLNEWRPWNYSVGNTAYGFGVTVSDVDDHTGMEVGVTISLDTGHAYVTIQPWATNNTGEAHQFQLWLNAMIAMGGNHVSGPTQFVIPASEVTIHTAADGGVPGSGSPMSWPFYGGRDLSWYSNWNGYIGFFAPTIYAGFTGIYDHAIDQGIVRSFNPGWPAGTKIFGPSTLSSSYWTDDSSNYIELWSGATGSFWNYGTLNPGKSFGWAEHWYPVHGIGGFNYANRHATLRLSETGIGAEVAVAVSGGISGKVTLWAGGQLTAEWPLSISPGQAFRATWTRPAGVEGSLGLRLEGVDGAVIAQTGQVP